MAMASYKERDLSCHAPVVPFVFEGISNGLVADIEFELIGDFREGLATLLSSCSYYMMFVCLSKLQRMSSAWQVFS